MSKQPEELVEVIGPQGQRKKLPPAAANAPEIRVLGFTPVHEIMPPVRVSAAAAAPVTEEPEGFDPIAGEDAEGPAPVANIPAKRGPGRPKASANAH